jgi:hypothetical protein
VRDARGGLHRPRAFVISIPGIHKTARNRFSWSIFAKRSAGLTVQSIMNMVNHETNELFFLKRSIGP